MTTPLTANANTGIRRGTAGWAGQMIAALVFFGAILFLAAGRLDWTAGWVYLGLNALTQILSALVLIPRQSGMLAERSRIRAGTKNWDRILAPAIVVAGTLAVLVTAGLDARFDWSGPVDMRWWAAGLLAAFLSQMFVLWAMACNPFFALTVRIQDDRGQVVANGGPYRLVRHPGYAGSVVYNLAVALVLGSWWTLIPALLTAAMIVLRTGLEDRTLCKELPGYREYASAVRYRLIPGIW